MTHEKLVAGTESPTRYTKIIRYPGSGTKYNRTYQETEYVSRYTKTAAPGISYKPPAPPEPDPEPEFDPPIVATKAQMSELNVYEVGETIEAFAATWRNGNPDNQTYRSRWQYRATADDAWVNTSWTTHVNQQVKSTTVIDEPGIYRFNTQVRDSTVDPVAQVNSFSQSKTIDPPPTTIGLISLTIDDVPVVWGEAVHVPVNTPVHVVATISGDANPNYKWEARGDYPLMVGSQTATTTLTFPQEGGPTVTLTATDSTATDSPINYAMNFYVASQTEWDILHPTTTN
jgi:hypothetical protein